MVPKELLACDERCAEGAHCTDLVMTDPATGTKYLYGVVHWRIVPFVRRADTGELEQVPDDGALRLPAYDAETIPKMFPVIADV